MSANGDAIVVWVEGGINVCITAGRIDILHLPRLGRRAFLLDSDYAIFPNVAMSANGDGIVTWSNLPPSGPSTGVWGKRFIATNPDLVGATQLDVNATYANIAMSGDRMRLPYGLNPITSWPIGIGRLP